MTDFNEPIRNMISLSDFEKTEAETIFQKDKEKGKHL